MNSTYEIILLYDGQCPICRREVAWLRARNKRGNLGLQDIHDHDFDPGRYGKSMADLMAEIHGLLPDGRLIKGVDVFYVAYRAVGLGWLVAPMRWTLFRPLFDRLYAGFARHRLRLGMFFGGKACQGGHCQIQRPET